MSDNLPNKILNKNILDFAVRPFSLATAGDIKPKKQKHSPFSIVRDGE